MELLVYLLNGWILHILDCELSFSLFGCLTQWTSDCFGIDLKRLYYRFPVVHFYQMCETVFAAFVIRELLQPQLNLVKDVVS